MSSRTKRRAEEPERKSGRNIKKAKRTKDEDDSFDEEASSGPDIKEELNNSGISTDNIITGRRTRGIRVDYTKVKGGIQEDEDEDDEDEEEEEEEERPKKSRQTKQKAPSSSKASASKKKPESKLSPKKPDFKFKPPSKPASTASSSKPIAKKRAVVESDLEEDGEDEGDEGDDDDD
ncbi:hypothetical protein K474DRAFT_1662258 [Panus rudis PR-1116 ss-1]|nr:hypothetical protein K474DRAFT_1662258 [Panus rudis PR-1116 ss-1]